jgi:zinc transport system ATP-binding protein
MDETLLKVSDLKVVLNNQVILDNVNFELGVGETLAIIGPNGAGKTTLFRALLGLVYYEGKIEWKEGIKIGYVPQRLSIENGLPLTTKDFFELRGKKINPDDIKRAMEIVGLKNQEKYLKLTLGSLSGGELQRILIAWAILDHPQVLLFDEPTAGVDVAAEGSIYSLLHQIQKSENLTILLISHELELVFKYANNVVCLNKQSVCYGPPKDVFNNENLVKLFGPDMAIYQHH